MMESAQASAADAWIPTHCSMCYHGCPILAHRVNGTLVKIEGNPTCPGTRGRICPKGNAGIMRLYDPNRLKTPLKRTNPKKGLDEDPGWVDITWDEAKEILLEKLRRIRAEDPAGLVMGGFNTHSWYWSVAFGLAFGTPNATKQAYSAMGHMCGEGSHLAGGMIHNSMNTHPDLEYANYVIVMGAALGEAYQSAVAYGRILGDAREARPLKLIVVDPQQSRAAAKADEWIPIRPATDGAMLFGMMHVLVHERGSYDRVFLQTHTNAGYLVGADGRLLRNRDTGKPLVWDTAARRARDYDDSSLVATEVALEGEFQTAEGAGVPAFELFKRSLTKHTPEWAETITSVPAATIRRIATEFGEAACIGQTIELEGRTYPYRPACIAGYRGLGAHSNGMHASWAAEMMNLLIGGTRAVGGVRAWDRAMCVESPATLSGGPDGLVTYGFPPEEFSFPPKSITLTEYFPLAFTPGLACFEAQLEPEKYRIASPTQLLIFDSGNPILTGHNPGRVMESLKTIPYVVDITIYLDETALFADLVIPDVTYLERWGWEGTWSVEDEGLTIQRPVVEPLYGIRHNADLYIELAQALGIQTGPTGMSSMLNMIQGGTANDISHPYRNAEEYVRAYVHASARDDEALVWKQGHNLRRIPPHKRYMPDCLGGLKFPFYMSWLLDVRETLRKNMDEHRVFEKVGLEEDFVFFEYAGLPFWHESIIEHEPPEFDLYVINWRTPIAAVGAGTVPATNAWLLEVAERDPYLAKILINTKTARSKGLRDGEQVCVESPHGKMTGTLKCTETIHPEVIGTIGCWGHRTDAAVAKGRGPGNFNALLGSGLKYMGATTLQVETAARAKIYRYHA